MTIGRPTDYTLEKAQYMCERIASCTVPISELCETDEQFPHESNFYKWLLRHSEFRELYLEAREIQGFAYSDKMLRDVDNCPPISEEIQLQTLKTRTLQWHLTRVANKYFGDKKQVDTKVEFVNPADALRQLD